jgi:hypothetical protein
LIIFDQLDPSAQAPWTTITLTAFEDIVAALLTPVRGVAIRFLRERLRVLGKFLKSPKEDPRAQSSHRLGLVITDL